VIIKDHITARTLVFTILPCHIIKQESRAGGPRDAAVNFDKCWIL